MLKVVTQMMDNHINLKQLVHNGDLVQHAGKLDVHQMLMTHRGETSLRRQPVLPSCGISCVRVLLRKLRWSGDLAKCGPRKCCMGSTLDDAGAVPCEEAGTVCFPELLATPDGDLGKMVQPTFRRLEYNDDADDTGSRQGHGS